MLLSIARVTQKLRYLPLLVVCTVAYIEGGALLSSGIGKVLFGVTVLSIVWLWLAEFFRLVLRSYEATSDASAAHLDA